MNILLLNWWDPTHPWAGGAEAYCFQIARRWVQGGHRVTWFCGRHEDQSSNGSIEGIEIIRRGGFYSVYPHGALCYLTRFRGQFDVILDGANGIPFFTPLYSRIPKIALVHHVHSEVFFRELPSHLAHLANLMERVGMPLVYRHVPFITVSESSRRALVKLGIPAEQISIVHNGVDCTWHRPGAKSDTPLVAFLLTLLCERCRRSWTACRARGSALLARDRPAPRCTPWSESSGLGITSNSWVTSQTGKSCSCCSGRTSSSIHP